MMARFTYIIILIALVASGCKKEGSGSCFQRAKENGTLQLNLNNFNAIALYDDINLEVNFDSITKVKLIGPNNLLEHCEVEIQSNTLVAKNYTKCYVTKGYDFKFTLQITLPQLDSIYTDGYGNIDFLDTLKQAYFKLENFGTAGSYNFLVNTDISKFAHHLGSADITISGTSKTSEIFLGSNGRIDAQNLENEQTFVNHDGDGNIYVNTSEYLYYSLTSYGDLYASGNPKIIEGTRTGKGNFFP